MKIGVVSLGCPKNLVDSEVMLGLIKARNWIITNEPATADLIIINTCGFIESAKEESINTILQMAEFKKQDAKKKILVTGCLGQRYAKELFQDLPEIDGIMGTECYNEIGTVIDRLLLGERFIYVEPPGKYSQPSTRVLTTPSYSAYLKIAEGCNNYCSFCAIPLIRGPYRSRPYEEILAEAKDLVHKGVREIIVVAQDTTQYGKDLYGSLRLAELLKDLNALPELKWIRVMYSYPESFSDELIEAYAACSKVCAYVDLPLQHASDSLLKSMRRRDTRAQVEALINKLRARIPSICIRTTFIVGFPGETEKQFQELLDFTSRMKFNCAGVFTYSKEEGTLAAKMPNQVPEEIKEDRYHRLMALQAQISEEINEAREGKEDTVVVEGFDADNPTLAYGRSPWEAPDVDGTIFLENGANLTVGSFYQVKFNQGFTYELVGEVVGGPQK